MQYTYSKNLFREYPPPYITTRWYLNNHHTTGGYMIIFVVYTTEIVDNKLKFNFMDSYEQYDDAVSVAESIQNAIVVPFDDDDNDEESYFED